MNKYILFILLLNLQIKLHGQVHSTKLYIQNPKKFEFEIILDYNGKILKTSSEIKDSLIIKNPIYNLDIKCRVYNDEGILARIIQLDRDIVNIYIDDVNIVAPISSYNDDLLKITNFKKELFSRDSLEIYGLDEVRRRMHDTNVSFYLKYPKSEFTLTSLLIDRYCNRIPDSLVDAVSESWDKTFYSNYRDAKILLNFKNRKYYNIGDKFPLGKFIKTIPHEQSRNKLKLIMITDPNCGFTEHWINKLEKSKFVFNELYYFHIETDTFNTSTKTAYFTDILVKKSKFNKNLLGFIICETPYFVVLDSNNRIRFFGNGGFLLSYLESLPVKLSY